MGPPQPQLLLLRDPRVTLPSPARQMGAKQARQGQPHVAAVPRQQRRRAMLTLQLGGDPSGGHSHAWRLGHLPGMRCQGSILGAAGKAPCREEALRLPTGSAAASEPPPPPGASSCPVRRDLPPEQEKRNESDGAHGPPAPPGGEGGTTQLPPFSCRVEDTPPRTEQEHLPTAPAFQGGGSMTSRYLLRCFTGTYFCLKMAGVWGKGKSILPSTEQPAQLHHLPLEMGEGDDCRLLSGGWMLVPMSGC